MSNNFSYLKHYKELNLYLDAVKKIIEGEYISNLEEIKKKCLKSYHETIPWGEKGFECSPDAQVFFRITSEKNEMNKRLETNSEESEKRKKTLEKVFA